MSRSSSTQQQPPQDPSSSLSRRQQSHQKSIHIDTRRRRRRSNEHNNDNQNSGSAISPTNLSITPQSSTSSTFSDTSSENMSPMDGDHQRHAASSSIIGFPPLDSSYVLRDDVEEMMNEGVYERQATTSAESPLHTPSTAGSTFSSDSTYNHQDNDDYYDYASIPSIEPFQTPLPFDSKLFRVLESELRSYKDKGRGIIGKLRKVSKRQQEKIQRRRFRLQKRMRDPNFVKTKDKVAFTGGVINVILTTVIASRFPSLLPLWFLLWSCILLAVRFYLYHSQHFHYFMLDFCYLANLLFIFYLFCYPTSPHLFILNMTNANGPLLWAVVMWRNSLVFHDLDKITSTFIHCLPVIVSFIVRWVPESGEHAVCLNPECSVSFMDIIVPHMVFFVFWEICYYLKTEVIDKDRLDADERLITSFRYLKKSAESKEQKSIGYRFMTAFGPKYQVLMFMIIQGMYHLTTILTVKFMYEYMYFHLLVISAVFSICVWNGSTFYIVKFTVAYQKRMAQLEDEARKQRETEHFSTRRHHHHHSKQSGGVEVAQESAAIEEKHRPEKQGSRSDAEE